MPEQIDYGPKYTHTLTVYFDRTSPRFGQPWRWNIKARNSRIIASGEAYCSRVDLMTAVCRMFGRENMLPGHIKHVTILPEATPRQIPLARRRRCK